MTRRRRTNPLAAVVIFVLLEATSVAVIYLLVRLG